MPFCGNCGQKVSDSDCFCSNCGAYVGGTAGGETGDKRRHGSGGGNSSFIDTLSGYLGHDKSVQLNWKDLFTNVFKRHTQEEAEDIFICGTSRTTPALGEVSDTWPKPWLYSRVLLCFVCTYVLLYCCASWFNNPLVIPGMMIIGAFAVPFATMVLFMEVNAFRNISIYSIFVYFLVGGCASLLVTLFFFDLGVLDTDIATTWGAMMVGVIEELGKAVIVYVLLRRLPHVNYILPALLVCACVGAGFAAFESAGYAYMQNSFDSLTFNIYLRGFLAPGGHVAWAAITAGAMVIAKGSGPLTSSVFTNGRFLRIFIIPVVLHGLWDAPIFQGYLKLVALIVMVWIVVLILINMGLEQVSRLKQTTTI